MAVKNTQLVETQAITVRPAELKDASAIARLGAHTFTVSFGHSVESHDLEAFLEESYSTSAIIKDLDDTNKDVFVASDSQGTILGFAYLTRNSREPCVEHLQKTVELQRIYVHPLGHGKGIGKALADKIKDTARQQGFRNIWLGCWQENARGMRAYGKWGFVKIGTHDFTIGKEIQRDDIMYKEI